MDPATAPAALPLIKGHHHHPWKRFASFALWHGEVLHTVFEAKVGSLLVKTAVGVADKVIKFVWDTIRDLFFVTFELTSRDESYNWMVEWLNIHPITQDSSNITLSTTWFEYDEGDKRPRILLTPNVGNHRVTYKGKYVWVSRSKEENYPDLLANGGALETITLTTLRGNRDIILDLMKEAIDISEKRDVGKTIIYTATGSSWVRFGPARTVRPLDSVFLAKGYKQALMKDINEFYKSSEWYFQRGIPYRRGYLLYGPPGSGKTSFITALAGHLGLAICIVNLNHKDLSDEGLTLLLNKTPTRQCILLIEDVDAAPAAVSRSSGRSGGVTLSGLLNALDGVASQEGRLLFMTTNHMEKLDHALLRPGRVDRKFQLGYSTKYQLKKVFQTFYPEDTHFVSEWVNAVPENEHSMAQLQAYLMYFKDDPKSAVANVEKIREYTEDLVFKPVEAIGNIADAE